MNPLRFLLCPIVVVCCLAFTPACADDGLPAPPPGGADVDADQQADSPFVAVDVTPGADVGPDVTGEDVPSDTAPETWDGPPPVDTTFPDLIPDLEPPSIVTTSPAHGEDGVVTPLVVMVTFNEAVAPNTIAPQTFQVLDPEGNAVAGDRTISEDGATVTFTATQTDYWPASPYEVHIIGGIVADQAGNKLQETLSFKFYTATWSELEVYHAVAEAYAPTVHISTMEGTPQAHVPTTFDADGDWDGANNVSGLIAGAFVAPAVYYDVLETWTHYFIHYMYLFPWVNHPVDGHDHANGTPGILVTVAKATADAPERPVAVTTYYKEKLAEENVTYVTDESGFVPAGATASFYGVEGRHPQAELFPDGHFESFITAAEHESCAWIDPGDTLNCAFTEAQKGTMQRFVLRYASGDPTLVEKAGGWPLSMADMLVEDASGELVALESLDYALVPATDTLWPRRADVGPSSTFAATYSYGPAPTGVGEGGLELSSKFTDGVDDEDFAFGRPMWAWDFNPGFGETKGIQMGWMGVDPAYYILKRHGSVLDDNAVVAYDPETGEGISTDYCFNPYAGVDNRGTVPLCGGSE